MRPMFRAFAGTLLACLLAACGGGGGDDEPPDGPYDVATAWRNAQTSAYEYTVSATASGSTLRLSVEATPAGASTYPRTGAAANRTDLRASVRVNGGTPIVASSTIYYTGTANVIGVAADDGSCTDVVTTLPLPANATIGASGVLYSATTYADCSPGGTDVVGSTAATWSVEVDSNVVLFCINSTDRDDTGALVLSTGECLEIGQNGSLGGRARVTLTVPGQAPVVLYSN